MTQKHGAFHSTNAQLQVTTGHVVSRRKVCCNWLEIKRRHFQIMTSHTLGKEEKYTNLVHYFNSIPSIFMKCHLLWWLPHASLLMRNNLEQVLGVTTIPPSTGQDRTFVLCSCALWTAAVTRAFHRARNLLLINFVVLEFWSLWNSRMKICFLYWSTDSLEI